MNEQLQQELAAWLGKLREAADAGASFALEQAPLIVQEKVAYGRVYHTLWVLLAVVIFAATLYFIRRAFARAADDDPADWVSATFLGGLSFIVVPVLLAENVHGCIQAWFAPRLYVLEWLAGLLK